MLIKKKADKKRMTIYFAIIGIMVSATAFLILKNMKIGNDDMGDLPEYTQPASDTRAQATEVVVPQIDLRKDNPIQILDNPKFKILENNIFADNVQSQKNVGRENPFEPRELKAE